MKVKSLKINDFFVLKNFNITFHSNRSIMIGKNGCGKSTIIELIADIFGHLHKYFQLNDHTAAFVDGYQIIYEIFFKGQSLEIEIHSHYVEQVSNTFKPQIWINHEALSLAQIERQYGGMQNLIPSKIILSYAGISTHLKLLSEHFEKKYTSAIIKTNNPYSLNPLNLPIERPFIYIKPEHLSIIIISLLSSKEEAASNILSSHVNIDINSCELEFVLKKPSWAKKKSSESNKWWGIKGNIALQFLGTIDQYAHKEDFTEKTISYTFYGIPSLQDMFNELNAQNRCDIIFTILDTLIYDDLLSDIKIKWKNNLGDIVEIDRLSEGQKQIIQICGINYIFGNTHNLLYLFDEPDVFLHPQWQQEFLTTLTSQSMNSHIIITTHNPIIIGDSSREDIHIIEDGREKPNEFYSQGRDVNSLLYDYFNINERNKFGETLLHDFYDAMNTQNYDIAEKKLKQLRNTFGTDDLEVVKADSLYDDLAE